MNYTRPKDPNHEDTSQDWLMGAIAFTRALSLLTKPDEGIIIKAVGELEEYFKDSLLFIFNNGTQMQIASVKDFFGDDHKFKEGDYIGLKNKEEEESEDEQ